MAAMTLPLASILSYSKLNAPNSGPEACIYMCASQKKCAAAP